MKPTSGATGAYDSTTMSTETARIDNKNTAATAPGVHSAPTPRWMGRWLAFAGVYNIAWGGVMVLAPIWTLKQLGVAPVSTELWPQLWACIGMIIGVYGVGYILAARDPARHWPIVLVGLLGKILGPIGFVDAAVRGQLPWSMGATILTNDLLWWIPFALILRHAAQRHSRRAQLA